MDVGSLIKSLNATQLVLPLALAIAGFPVGLIFERLVLTRFKKTAAQTKWEIDDIVISSLRGVTTVWFVAAGFYGAILITSMNQGLRVRFEKALLVAVILSVTLMMAKISVGLVNLYTKRVEGILPSTSIFANLTRILVFIVGVLVVFASLDINITPILTALGVGGLAVALALQDTLSNLFSGLHILASRQVKPGDYIKLDSGVEGYVVDVTWRNTVIRGISDNITVIPNSKLASAIITNYDLENSEYAVPVQVGVSYDSDLERVEKVTIEVAKEVMREIPGGVPEFEPAVRYHTFGDSGILFNVILRVREFADRAPVVHEFVKKLHKRYKEEGIEIPYPIRIIYTKQES